MIREVTLPGGQSLKVPGIVPRLSDTPGDLDWVGPKLGEHTAQVLLRCGYGEAEITALRERGIV
jgi:formyl-CoA transferase